MRFLALLLLACLPVHAQDAEPREMLETARIDERNVLDQINDVDRQLNAVSSEAADLQQRISDYEASRLRHQDEVASANALLEKRRDDVSTRIGDVFMLSACGFRMESQWIM